MTLFKWFAGTLLSLVLLVSLAILIVPRVVDPNDFREEITRLVKQQTGRELQLQGDLSVSLFPWLGIRTQGLKLAQPNGIEGDMLTVQTAQLRVKLLPLFSRRLEVDTVVLEGPRLNLVTLPGGVNSLTGLSTEGVGKNGVDGDPVPKPEKPQAAVVALVIQGLQLTDGSLLWDDQETGQRYQLSELNVQTGNLLGDSLASLEASGIITDASSAQPFAFKVDGAARIDTKTLQLTAQAVRAELQQSTQSLQIEVDELVLDQQQGASLRNTSLKGLLMLEQEQSEPQPVTVSASINQLSFNFDTGQINISDVQGQVIADSPNQPELKLNSSLPALEFNTESGRITASNIELTGQLANRDVKLTVPEIVANLESQAASFDSLQLDSADLSASLRDLTISQFIDNPAISGVLQLQAFNAAKLLQDLEIDYTTIDPDALQSVALQTSFSGGLNELEMNSLELILDQSKLTGSFAAKDFENMQVEFELVLDQLNLDRYLPENKTPAVSGETDSNSGAAALAVPMALLKDISANGSFKADQLISGGLELTAIDVQIVSTPGQLTITPKADLYEGKLDGSMVYSENGDVSTLQINNRIDLVSLGKFLDAADVSDQLSGIGSLGLDIVVTESGGVQKNSGTIKLFASNGAIKGVDVKKVLDQGYQQYRELRGKEAKEETTQQAETGESQAEDETRFAELLGTFHLDDFQISNNDFEMKAPLFRIKGEGNIDIARAGIDYLLNVSIVKSTSGQGGDALEQLEGITLPIRFSGSLYSPDYSLDMKALYKGLAKKELEEKKSEYLQEKLGIEDGGILSTRELLQQILINKANEKTAESEAQSEPADSQPVDSQPADSQQGAPEQVATPSDTNHQEPENRNQTDAVPDVYADPNVQQGQLEPEPPKSSEEQLKDELKKKLLEGLFN